MAVATDDRAAIEPVLDGIERWVLGHRHIVAPPLMATAMWCSSAAAWALTGAWNLGWYPLGVYVALVVTVELVFGVDVVHTTERVPLVGADRPGERADEPAVLNTKVVSGAGWVVGGAWCLAHAWWGPSVLMAGLLGLMLVPAWVAWFHSRRIRRGVEVFRDKERWDGDAVGAPGLEAREAGAKGAEDGSWWEVPLKSEPKGRWTASAIRKLVPRIAARYEVDPAEVEIVEDRPGRFTFRYTRADPDEKPLTFEAPPANYSIRQRARVGRWDDDGSPMLVSLYRDDHGGVDGLGIGVKGGGKSNLAEIEAVFVAAAKDALLWVIDLKPGAPQWSPYARVADWLATTPDEADRMFRALLVVMQVRGGSGGRIVKPSTKRPAIVVKLDEGALYFNPVLPGGDFRAKQALQARITLVENVLATSRSYGVAVQVYVQRAIWDNVGGATIRGHLVAGQAAIFKTAKNEDARLAIDMTADDAERMRTSAIPRSRPGTCYIQNADNEEARRGRIFNLTEPERDAVLAKHRDTQPALEQPVVDALGEPYANRQRGAQPDGPALALVDDQPVDNEQDDDPPTQEAPARVTAAESQLLVWQAVAGHEPHGAGSTTIAKDVGKSPTMVRTRLKELEALGAVRHERRRWLVLGTETQLREAQERAAADEHEQP